MPNEPKLRLTVHDVYGKPIREKIDVILRHQVLSEVVRASATGATPIDITGLRGTPQGLYRIEVDPPSYQYISQFVNLKASGITPLTITFPIDPTKVKKVSFPSYQNLSGDLKALLKNSGSVLALEGKTGRNLYEAFDDIRRAGLLNIATKTAATPLTNKRTVLSYIRELKEIRGDRFFAVVPKELREETKNSVAEGLFHDAGEILHHPPSGFTHAGSFKTPDHYGNLQLTFFMSGDDCRADVDIDDAAGLEHVFQVVGNKLSGKPTHPYNIHEVLVGYQHLDPGYTFQV
ncbi:MAG TPA: hypothetical protein VE135_08395 [Pyrinomonadaceae bacterium]|nr:hypothetical protein [Pyrinomonadaceae bacterium]